MSGKLYYAKGLEVWKSPLETKVEGGSSISVGFPVCTVSDYVGEEGASSVAELLHLGETGQTTPARAGDDAFEVLARRIETSERPVGGGQWCDGYEPLENRDHFARMVREFFSALGATAGSSTAQEPQNRSGNGEYAIGADAQTLEVVADLAPSRSDGVPVPPLWAECACCKEGGEEERLHPVNELRWNGEQWCCEECGAGEEPDLWQAAPRLAIPSSRLFTSPPSPASKAVLCEDGEQIVADAVRSAYDRGYNDSRIAKSVPGDNAPGYRGRDMSEEIAADVLARLRRILSSRPNVEVPEGWKLVPVQPPMAMAPTALEVKPRGLFDGTVPMADGGEVPMTAAEEVLVWLLVEKIGVPDDVSYSPDQAQDIIASRIVGASASTDEKTAEARSSQAGPFAGGLAPAPQPELGPDGKEWAKTEAGDKHVESVVHQAHQGSSPIGGMVWHGHAVRQAFVAGAEWQEARNKSSPAPEPHSLVERHPDDFAVDRFAAAMKAKFAKKRDEGRIGWEDKHDCSQLRLSKLLREHVEKGDPVDVGNLAMMLHQREERISSLLETLQGE